MKRNICLILTKIKQKYGVSRLTIRTQLYQITIHLATCFDPLGSSSGWHLTRYIEQEYTWYSAFVKSLCTYKRCWKWCPRASIQAWTRLILFANTFCKSAFGKSLCTYKMCWKWCPRASTQAWTRLILFPNTYYRSAFGKSLCTYKRCWKWCPRASIQAWTVV
jgi:hypothetical protein